jgi:hypothetical protein
MWQSFNASAPQRQSTLAAKPSIPVGNGEEPAKNSVITI